MTSDTNNESVLEELWYLFTRGWLELLSMQHSQKQWIHHRKFMHSLKTHTIIGGLVWGGKRVGLDRGGEREKKWGQL